MSRTRGASGVIHADDGELLDKDGKPLPVTAVRNVPSQTWTGVPGQANPDPVPAVELPPEPPAPTVWRCDVTTMQRNMEAIDLAKILALVLGGISIDLDDEQFRTLHADQRQHFRRVA